ncbi:MAG TPA: hypothetical protein VG603_03465, partial [Chitinophagales bacterium]|nr:hypothetical protein [Chitinophagales bacterium]
MNRALRLLFIIAPFLPFISYGQLSYRLSGRVIADDFNPLYNASVYVEQFSTGTFTDSGGYFQLQLKPG